MQTDHHMARMTDPQTVIVPGAGRCDILPLDSLEALAFGAELTVTYPEGRGWATTRLGSHRWAAWVEAAVTV